MGWTLDREFFKHLIGLYLVSIALVGAVTIYEVIGWEAFSSEFDLLVQRHFGASNDTMLMLGGAILLFVLLWHLASLIALRKFRRWARWSFWASMILATLASFIPGIATPYFSSPLGSIFYDVSTGLFAAIFVLAYSRDHGGLWFKTPLETLKETF